MTIPGIDPPISNHPPTWKFDSPIIRAETREQWRTWLRQNHASSVSERQTGGWRFRIWLRISWSRLICRPRSKRHG